MKSRLKDISLLETILCFPNSRIVIVWSSIFKKPQFYFRFSKNALEKFLQAKYYYTIYRNWNIYENLF